MFHSNNQQDLFEVVEEPVVGVVRQTFAPGRALVPGFVAEFFVVDEVAVELVYQGVVDMSRARVVRVHVNRVRVVVVDLVADSEALVVEQGVVAEVVLDKV